MKSVSVKRDMLDDLMDYSSNSIWRRWAGKGGPR